MFEKLTSWYSRLRGSAADTSDACEDRRLWVRYPCEVETTFSPLRNAGAHRLEAQVQNISRGGISLLTRQEFEAGALLVVELPELKQPLSTAVLAYVVRCTPKTKDTWETGCIFALELPDDELTQFGALRRETDTADHRSWVRFPCKARATFQRVKQKEQPPQSAQLIDISANGLGLQVAEAIEVGSLLNVQIHTLSGATNMPMLVSVVRVSAVPNQQWLLGCNFLRELSDRELHPFVKTSS